MTIRMYQVTYKRHCHSCGWMYASNVKEAKKKKPLHV